MPITLPGGQANVVDRPGIDAPDHPADSLRAFPPPAVTG